MAAPARITLDRVKVGDVLPELAVDVDPTTVVLGALASRDWRPMHHDKDFAQERNGTAHIFINTPHNAAYFERYITDWTGPTGRLGRIQFRMKDSVFPGDTMVFHGAVAGVGTDERGCGWIELALKLTVGDKTTTECTARVAVPTGKGDNPWKRKGHDWQP
ncbi:MAG: MaoC/PaaZ C-terminal domain-containing protein [Proteobacteria bacterium]|nr:MaoC/PaaZ C-terminal domain-containing protein [Pseudomonadota bacterium]